MKKCFVILLWWAVVLNSAFAQAPRIRFKCPARIFKAGEYEISWKVEGEKIKRVYMERLVPPNLTEKVEDNLPLEGTRKVFFDQGFKYKIVAETRRDVRYVFLQPRFEKLIIQNFQVSNKEINEGEEVELSWSVSPSLITQVDVENNGKMVGKSLPDYYSLKVRPDTSGYYAIVASIKDTDVKLRDSIFIVVKPVIYFTAQAFVNQQDSVSLKWKMSRLKNIQIYSLHAPLNETDLVNGVIPTNIKKTLLLNYAPREGTFMAKPLAKGQKEVYFLLVAENENGKQVLYQTKTSLFEMISEATSSQHSQVQISCKVNGKPTKDYYSKFIFPEGSLVELSWQIKNAESVKLLDFRGKTIRSTDEGIYRFVLLSSQQFVLTAENENGHQVRIINVLAKTRFAYIKNTKDVSQLSPKDDFKMEVFEVDRKNYPNEIRLKVLAYDEQGNFITGLSKNKHFKKLIENVEGKKNEISSWNVQEIAEKMDNGIALSICSDYSGSMSGGRVEVMEKALKIFLNSKFKQAGDVISMTKFDHKLKIVVPLTEDKDKILKNYKFVGLDGFGGATALYAGIDEAMKSLEGVQDKEKYLIVCTDGYENSSFQYFETHAFNAQQVALKAREKGIKIITVAFGENTNEPVLKTLAYLTDGYFYNVYAPEDLIGVYQEIPRLFRHYYLITYKPLSKDGLREINLQYYDNQQERTIPTRQIQIGEKFNILDLDTDGGIMVRNGNNANNKLFPGKKMIVSPQTVVNFEFSKANLEIKYRANLQSYLNYLQKRPNACLGIYGHTDLVGEAKNQEKLGFERAKAVKDFFVQNGISENRLKVQSFGKTLPIWGVEQHAWQARENRRVEIAIFE
ncbi:MAG: VWA domain-containing protein [Raineya sp.]|nr:VWA domain-containing protein [Raineya sp.]MDW8295831.1 VWA domain-containing protein [Raineya sp.]